MCLLPYVAVERPVFDEALPKGALGLQENSSTCQHMTACDGIIMGVAAGTG